MDNGNQNQIKTVNVELTNSIKPKSIKNTHTAEASMAKKIPKKRVVTETSKWHFGTDELSYQKQFEYMNQIHQSNITPSNESTCKFILQQINQKIYGYGSQDLKKKKMNTEQFIQTDDVIKLMIECKNMCFYCKEPVQVLYENVREPKQWSLDRLDNNFGHNKNNVVISCLICNLRRKTMYHERYAFTKQLNIVKTN